MRRGSQEQRQQEHEPRAVWQVERSQRDVPVGQRAAGVYWTRDSTIIKAHVTTSQITLYEKARSKDKVLAVVSRRPLLGNAPASPPAKGTCEYHVVVQPGVDIAFVLALVSVVDCSAVARTAQPAAPAVPVKRAVGVAA